jgi:hypothetical protein
MGNVQLQPSVSSSGSELPVTNAIADLEEKIVQIGPPPADLRQQCERWTKMATFLEVSSYHDFERRAKSFDLLWKETRFNVKSNCCAVCWSLKASMDIIVPDGWLGWTDVGLDVFDDVYINVREPSYNYRFFIPSSMSVGASVHHFWVNLLQEPPHPGSISFLGRQTERL